MLHGFRDGGTISRPPYIRSVRQYRARYSAELCRSLQQPMLDDIRGEQGQAGHEFEVRLREKQGPNCKRNSPACSHNKTTKKPSASRFAFGNIEIISTEINRSVALCCRDSFLKRIDHFFEKHISGSIFSRSTRFHRPVWYASS